MSIFFYYEEQVGQSIALAAVTLVPEPSTNCQEVLEDVAIDVRTHPVSDPVSQSSQTLLLLEEEKDEISYEEPARFYTLLYES